MGTSVVYSSSTLGSIAAATAAHGTEAEWQGEMIETVVDGGGWW